MRYVIPFLILISVSSGLKAQIGSGTIGNSQTICYGYAPAGLYFIEPPSGGLAPYSYRWQRSNDGTTWNDITGSTGSRTTFSPPVLARTTFFRCRISDALSNQVTSNIVTITVAPGLDPGAIQGNQTVYSGTTPSTLQEFRPASGGSGSYSFQWQSSSDGQTWADIDGADEHIYTPSALISDRWFRRMTSDGLCGISASNSIKITINQITLFTTETPYVINNESVHYDMGTEFQVLADGFITKARLYTDEMEAGFHVIRLWIDKGSGFSLLAGPFNWTFQGGMEGWREFELPVPVRVEGSEDYRYMISITNVLGNFYYSQSSNYFTPALSNGYIRYTIGRHITPADQIPFFDYYQSMYFRDVVFIPFSPGSAGVSQTVCYNSTPATLSETVSPEGGTGEYLYQWQSSADSITWTDITGAASSDYAPPEMLENTYFRRVVSSGNMTVACSPVLISTFPQVGNAQLTGNLTIYENTATNFSVTISGGKPPYTVTYMVNGTPQTPVTDYYSGEGISTGILNSGTYTYTLISVSDSRGCQADDLGSTITITASGTYTPAAVTGKALVLINANSPNYPDYANYIKPYLLNFGIPFDEFDSPVHSGHPPFNNYALIIFGHPNVYSSSGYPVTDLINALNGGTGLYSFDPVLFLNTTGTISTDIADIYLSANQIDINNTSHFITEYHQSDSFDLPLINGTTPYSNNYEIITLRDLMPVNQTTTLTNGSNLAIIADGENYAAILETSEFSTGRVVKWNTCNWMYENYLGPVFGMDDILWRSIVWAARKPFVMQGLPPIITMRVDDVDGAGSDIIDNFIWIEISNEFDLIPWCGTFNDNIPASYVSTFKSLLDNNRATASPHAFDYETFIYYNHYGESGFNPAYNVIRARDYYLTNQLPMSKYVASHYYELDLDALEEMHNMGIEFIATHMPFSSPYHDWWLEIGPYRTNRDMFERSSSPLPVYYADFVSGGAFEFFNCVTEIRDDDGYEWVPRNDDIINSVAQGVRQLNRAMTSMVLPTLFTHQQNLSITESNWRNILSQIHTAMERFEPQYKSMDYAVQYIRARNNLTITNVTDETNIVNITFTGQNDMNTKCYLFTESGSGITHKLVTLPSISSGSLTVSTSK